MSANASVATATASSEKLPRIDAVFISRIDGRNCCMSTGYISTSRPKRLGEGWSAVRDFSPASRRQSGAADYSWIADPLPKEATFAYDATRPDGLWTQMERALRSDLGTLGEAARQHVLRWDWMSMARATRRVYEGQRARYDLDEEASP